MVLFSAFTIQCLSEGRLSRSVLCLCDMHPPSFLALFSFLVLTSITILESQEVSQKKMNSSRYCLQYLFRTVIPVATSTSLARIYWLLLLRRSEFLVCHATHKPRRKQLADLWFALSLRYYFKYLIHNSLEGNITLQEGG